MTQGSFHDISAPEMHCNTEGAPEEKCGTGRLRSWDDCLTALRNPTPAVQQAEGWKDPPGSASNGESGSFGADSQAGIIASDVRGQAMNQDRRVHLVSSVKGLIEQKATEGHVVQGCRREVGQELIHALPESIASFDPIKDCRCGTAFRT
eukprot:CAMPEP_0181523280 /NCGR_PEP_ID=MMETSP1110-20121109/67815_1 /TAXON_ID=174948 /ORGANISM="Symbiodinium sp., Strain CCMP421" /LENGTH=149 /DNA_ID=CAMNT_0023653937 /DNA_START=154 /DNA_END=602 /DNA_ORIENTATION=+